MPAHVTSARPTPHPAPPTIGSDPAQPTREALARIRRARNERSSRRVRVLVIGNFGSGNTGDEAILAGLSDGLVGDADVTVVSRRPEAIKRIHGLPAVPMMSWRGVWAFFRTDAVAVGGGGLFGKGLPPLVALLPFVLLAARCVGRKRIVLQALGVYPDTPRGPLLLLRIVARLADAVSVRDEISQATLRSGPFGYPSPQLVADPSFYMRSRPAALAQAELARHGVTVAVRPLMISLKPTPDLDLNDRTLDVLAVVADWWLAARSSPVVVVPMSGQGDYGLGPRHGDARLGDRLRARCSAPERVVVLPEAIEPRLAKAVIGESAAVVGMRLHALLFSVGMCRPTLGLVFEHKTRSWLSQVGIAQLAVDTLTADRVIDWVARVTAEDAGPPGLTLPPPPPSRRPGREVR